MPIFFHSEAHLWIAYGLFFNGFLLNKILLSCSSQYGHLMRPLEAQVIMSFAFSLSFNGGVLLALDGLNISFLWAKYCLFGMSGLLLLMIFLRRPILGWQLAINYYAVGLYLLMFVVLFYNGGLIDQVSDAWWHMSLANKIGWASSFSLEQGHLMGVSERYYPPLWHGNLALLRELSDQGLPVLWNAFTAWGGVLKLMGYYLLGLALFNDKKVAVLGAVLFALLPGLGNSYMRVSAWPSHISYVFWFFSLFVVLRLFDISSAGVNFKACFFRFLKNYVALLILLLTTLLLMLVHQFEVLLLAAALFLYLVGLAVYRNFSKVEIATADAHNGFLISLYQLGLAVFAGLACWKLLVYQGAVDDIDYWLSLMLPLLIALLIFAANSSFITSKKLSCALLIVLFSILLMSINYQHLASLFNPELALPRGVTHERPSLAQGWFGSTLIVPGWHLQLRSGLLWSGVIASLLSVAMAYCKPSRGWVFIASNMVFVWVLCSSPYLYQWFTDLLQYHSTWRFAMLSFHPLAIAAFLVFVSGRLLASLRQVSHA